MAATGAPLRWLRGERSPATNTLWALDDVSFEVKHGEAVGIIGRNGAGKSTLLKILSRITKPTRGQVELYGRVGSLLEVGTGFHPELTGRENIYLNGAILGMRRAEIGRKFDEIVAFAETERFLDTPVKYYSSGMYVRLAFAVAAHLEPEILLVDEVLAVGDAEFQKKCLGKMSDVAHEGRTVLFVSHNMTAIGILCNHALLLEKGLLTNIGKAHDVISRYLSHNESRANPFVSCGRRGSGQLQITSLHFETNSGKRIDVLHSGQPVVFVIGYRNIACKAHDRISFSFSVHTSAEIGIFHLYSHFSGVYYSDLPESGYIRCSVPELPLSPNNYSVMCRVVMNGDQDTGEEVDWPQVYVPMTVTGTDFFGTGGSNLSSWGPVLIRGNWLPVSGN